MILTQAPNSESEQQENDILEKENAARDAREKVTAEQEEESEDDDEEKAESTE